MTEYSFCVDLFKFTGDFTSHQMVVAPAKYIMFRSLSVLVRTNVWPHNIPVCLGSFVKQFLSGGKLSLTRLHVRFVHFDNVSDRFSTFSYLNKRDVSLIQRLGYIVTDNSNR